MSDSWQCAVCLERQPLRQSSSNVVETICRDCGAPPLAVNKDLYPILSVCLGLQLRASGSSPATALDAGTAFLCAVGFDSEAALAAAVRGDGVLRLSAPPAAVGKSSLCRRGSGAPFFGLRASPRVGIAYDERHLAHVHPSLSSLHPERPDRASIAIGWLAATGLLSGAIRLATREATALEIASVAGKAHGKWLDKGGKGGGDTYLNNASPLAARIGLGSSIEATLAVWGGLLDRALVLVRPPGHHAKEDAGAGFCVYNNVAGAVKAALANGARRILTVDWDVHHGDGTEALFWDDPNVTTLSIHRYDQGGFYPGSGSPANVGGPKARGRTVNVGLNGEWFGDADLIAVFDAIVRPLTRALDPDMIIVSAGFDAARGDALGDCDVTPAGFAALTSAIISAAPRAPLILVLEGGYNLQAVGACVEAVTRVLFGETPVPTAAFDQQFNCVAEAAVLDGGDGGCGVSAYSREDAAALVDNLKAARRWREASVERRAEEVHPRRRVRPATWNAIEATLKALAPFWPCFAEVLAARGRQETGVEEEEEEEGGGGGRARARVRVRVRVRVSSLLLLVT